MQMRIRTETPQMQIDRKAPTRKVNRKKSTGRSVVKAPPKTAGINLDKSRQAALGNIGNAKDDNKSAINPNTPGGKSVQLQTKNIMKRALAKMDNNVGSMAAGSPEVKWDRGHMRINWSKHSVVIDWDGEYMPQMTVDPKYSVEVFLRTKPYFRVMVEEAVESGAPGRYIDHAV